MLKVFSPAPPENSATTRSSPKMAACCNITSQNGKGAQVFLLTSSDLPENSLIPCPGHSIHNIHSIQAHFQCFPPGRSDFPHFHLTQAPTKRISGPNYGVQAIQSPPCTRGMLTPLLPNNGTSTKHRGGKNHHIPPKKLLKGFPPALSTEKIICVGSCFLKPTPLPLSMKGHYWLHDISGLHLEVLPMFLCTGIRNVLSVKCGSLDLGLTAAGSSEEEFFLSLHSCMLS